MLNDILIVVGLILVGLAAIIFIPWWQVRRAFPKVIRVFRESNALEPQNARNIDELGLRPRGLLSGMLRGRDYRQYALTAMMQAGIVQATEDGRLFMVEEKLWETGLERRSP